MKTLPSALTLLVSALAVPSVFPLLAPPAVHASELNLDGMNRYASAEQVTSIDQFPDVKPTDWAYQALSNLIERYGCVAGYPDGTFRGGKAMTRYEAAALLNACLDRITEITDELKRLMKEFEKELAILRGRVDGLEAKVGELEATQFSTTTTLEGQASFVIGANSFAGDARERVLVRRTDRITLRGTDSSFVVRDGDVEVAIDKDQDGRVTVGGEDGVVLVDKDGEVIVRDDRVLIVDDEGTVIREVRGRKYRDLAASSFGATTFNYDVQLALNTSFTGKDTLVTILRAGNFADSTFGGAGPSSLSTLEVAFQEEGGSDVIGIDRLYYTFPIGNNFTATIGGRVGQEDMLAIWPTAYATDLSSTVLDIATLPGAASGAFNKNLGGGGGITWNSGGFAISANYVSANSGVGDPNDGGIATDGSLGTGTVQIGYQGEQWAIAGTYSYLQDGSLIPYGTVFLQDNLDFFEDNTTNAFGVSAYWQPARSSWIPSISVGWGINSHTYEGDTPDGAVTTSQSWLVGLEWNDVFLQGNSFGMAVGQPTFATALEGDEGARDGNYIWEWWYRFQVTDNIAVTPALFYLSRPLGQLTSYDEGFTQFGGLVRTTFTF